MSLDIIQIEKKLLNQSLNLDTYFLLKAFINALSKKGKLSKAKKIIANIAYFVKIKKLNTIYFFLYQAISIIRPLIGLKNQANLKSSKKPQVIPMSLSQSYQLAIRWLIEGAKQRSERTMSLRLFNELNDAFNKKGYALKKKYEWHSRLLSAQLKTYSFKKTKQTGRTGGSVPSRSGNSGVKASTTAKN